jgi:hypothetical protein
MEDGHVAKLNLESTSILTTSSPNPNVVSSNIPTLLIFILSRLTQSPSLFIILAQTNWIQYNIGG